MTVDGVAQNKWKDYYWDQQNQKAIFFSNTASGTNNVDISYKYGTSNWIYSDKALTSLSPSAFPRINILTVDGSGSRLGAVTSDIQDTILYQIDIWAIEDYIADIDGTKYHGDKLAGYLGLKIKEAFRSSSEELHPALFNIIPASGIRDLEFDVERQTYHKTYEIEANAINLGEITG